MLALKIMNLDRASIWFTLLQAIRYVCLHERMSLVKNKSSRATVFNDLIFLNTRINADSV